MLKPYSELVKIDVLPFCEKRKAKDDNGKPIEVPYLNWAKCKELLHENGAETVYYEPVLNAQGHSLFMAAAEFTDKNGGKNRCYEVRVRVFVDDQEWTMSYPLMNGSFVVRDDTINQLRVSNAQARAFVKCVAIHTGLGFSLWVKGGEPEEAPDEDLSYHNIYAIKKRIEQSITEKINRGMDYKDLLASADMNDGQVKKIMKYFDMIAELERRLNAV